MKQMTPLIFRPHAVTCYLSHSLADRRGATHDDATNLLHSSRLQTFRKDVTQLRQAHSWMLFSYLFLRLHLHLPPCTVLCRIVSASPRCGKLKGSFFECNFLKSKKKMQLLSLKKRRDHIKYIKKLNAKKKKLKYVAISILFL